MKYSLPGLFVSKCLPEDTKFVVTSDAIRVSRVLCIFFLMYVHVYSGSSGDFPTIGRFDLDDIIYRFFTDLLGRSSVPLLTIISGWLYFKSTESYRTVIGKKYRSLLVPLVVWNLIGLLALIGQSYISGKSGQLPTDTLSLINSITALYGQPADYPIAFLRDLFVVFLIAPLLRMAINSRFSAIAMVCGIAFGMFFTYTPIILRPTMIPFFMLGMWTSRKGGIIPKPALVIAALVVAVATFFDKMAAIFSDQNILIPGGNLLMRVSIAYIFWTIAYEIANRTHFKQMLLHLEPYMFFTFCSHAIFFKVFSIVGKMIFGDAHSNAYPIYFVIQPFIGLAFGIIASIILCRTVPTIFRVLNAGKLLPSRASVRMPKPTNSQ